MKHKAVGRPGRLGKAVLEYVDACGCSCRVLEVRNALGISASSAYKAVNGLISRGQLLWRPSSKGNYSLIEKSNQNYCFLDHLMAQAHH